MVVVLRLHEPAAKGIAATSLWSSRHARLVVAVTLLATLGLGYGVTLVTTNVDVADVLPRGDPNTAAAHNLTDQFKSTFTQQVTFQVGVDPDAWPDDNARLVYRDHAAAAFAPERARPDPNNITDEVYIRAMAELIAFIEDEAPAFERQVSINNIYALVNWTKAGSQPGEDPASFSLPTYQTPDGAVEYVVLDQATKAALLDAVDAISSPDWAHSAMLFMPAPDSDLHQAELGRQIIEARDAYVQAVADGKTVFTVFGPDNPPLLTVDLPVANAHSSLLVSEDLARLMPLVAGFIVASLFVAFRNVRAIAISFASLAIGVVWTYGVMGYMGIALNTLNMTIVPLVMGVGIDYSIHIINEFLEHKNAGMSDAAAFGEAGRRAGLAMLIATLTTILGLVVMMLSPSLLMAQLGFLSAVAIAAIYILTITFIPAALSLAGGTASMGASFSPSRFMPWLARGVSRTRVLSLLLVIGLTVGATMLSSQLGREAFGDPGRNFPADDPIRQEHEEGLRGFYGMEDPDVKANILTFEGPGILTPEAMAYMRTIEANLATKDRVIADTLRTVPFFIETWITVRNGVPGTAAEVTYENAPDVVRGIIEAVDPVTGEAGPSPTFPETEQEIREAVDAMFASPMDELASLIINHPTVIEQPEKGMAAMTFSVRAATYEDAEAVWFQIWDAVEDADTAFGGEPPEGVHVAFVGNTATNYLFVAKQLPWLQYMGYAATAILFVLVFLFTGSPRATLVATALAALTSIWWLGLLPLLDIGLAITLMLPLVFIFNIGTDYAVHIIWNMRQVGDARRVFETTGKAILFSAVTTAGAFAFFIDIQNVAVSRTMIATTTAIGVIFLATLLVVPIFYPVGPKAAPAAPDPPPPPRTGTPPPPPPRTGTPPPETPPPSPARPAQGKRVTKAPSKRAGKSGKQPAKQSRRASAPNRPGAAKSAKKSSTRTAGAAGRKGGRERR